MSKLQFTRVVRVHYFVRPLLGVTDTEEDERDEMTRRTTVGEVPVAYKLNQVAKHPVNSTPYQCSSSVAHTRVDRERHPKGYCCALPHCSHILAPPAVIP